MDATKAGTPTAREGAADILPAVVVESKRVWSVASRSGEYQQQEFLMSIVISRFPSRVLAYCVALLVNRRTRTALLAFFFGTFGVDMLTLRPHQVRLFLLLGGPLWAVVVVGGILSATSGAGWLMVSGAALVFLEFWAIARCFEALSHTDRSFERLLVESNRPAHQLDPASTR